MRVLPCGDRAALLELDDLEQAQGMHAALKADPPTGVTELVPAARTVLIRYDPDRTDMNRLADDVSRCRDTGRTHLIGDVVEVPVRYDGEDLADVARWSGLSAHEVIARHQAGQYTVSFSGFAPGFAYIAGLDPLLQTPRLDTPRTEVPAGAVAIAGEFTAIYPRRSPGGWRIIGHTDLPVWDLGRNPPMLLAPGTPVRFVDAARRSSRPRRSRAV